jgi:hypothetical protein
MGDYSYWINVARSAGLFILWTFICAGAVMGAERVGRSIFRRAPRA